MSYWPRVLGRPGPWAQSPSSIGATIRAGQGARSPYYRTVVTVFDQTGFDARLEWGVEGARVLAGRRDEPRSTGAPPRGSPDPSGPGGRPPYSLSPEHDVSQVVPVLRDGAFTAA